MVHLATLTLENSTGISCAVWGVSVSHTYLGFISLVEKFQPYPDSNPLSRHSLVDVLSI
jgi:hypothetical protein